MLKAEEDDSISDAKKKNQLEGERPPDGILQKLFCCSQREDAADGVKVNGSAKNSGRLSDQVSPTRQQPTWSITRPLNGALDAAPATAAAASTSGSSAAGSRGGSGNSGGRGGVEHVELSRLGSDASQLKFEPACELDPNVVEEASSEDITRLASSVTSSISGGASITGSRPAFSATSWTDANIVAAPKSPLGSPRSIADVEEEYIRSKRQLLEQIRIEEEEESGEKQREEKERKRSESNSYESDNDESTLTNKNNFPTLFSAVQTNNKESNRDSELQCATSPLVQEAISRIEAEFRDIVAECSDNDNDEGVSARSTISIMDSHRSRQAETTFKTAVDSAGQAEDSKEADEGKKNTPRLSTTSTVDSSARGENSEANKGSARSPLIGFSDEEDDDEDEVMLDDVLHLHEAPEARNDDITSPRNKPHPAYTEMLQTLDIPAHGAVGGAAAAGSALSATTAPLSASSGVATSTSAMYSAASDDSDVSDGEEVPSNKRIFDDDDEETHDEGVAGVRRLKEEAGTRDSDGLSQLAQRLGESAMSAAVADLSSPASLPGVHKSVVMMTSSESSPSKTSNSRSFQMTDEEFQEKLV